MKRPDALRALAGGAALVIIALTTAAFWLSYAHLQTVAADNGLAVSPARAWAWPATLDLFIVAGELLMLRASLARRVDWWAIGLTVVGSGGSIALNIAGVGAHREPLHYVVAAVPPTAALLAFGALMRQVHDALRRDAATAAAPASEQPASPATATRKTVGSGASELPAAPASRVPAPASTPRQPTAKPALPATTPLPAVEEKPAATASASDPGTGRDLADVAAAYRQLRASEKVHRPSAAKLGAALGVSRSRGQQLRDELENHPDYAAEFAPALKSA